MVHALEADSGTPLSPRQLSRGAEHGCLSKKEDEALVRSRVPYQLARDKIHAFGGFHVTPVDSP